MFAAQVTAQLGHEAEEFAQWRQGGGVAGGDGPAAAPFGFREDGFAADVGAFATEHGDVHPMSPIRLQSVSLKGSCEFDRVSAPWLAPLSIARRVGVVRMHSPTNA